MPVVSPSASCPACGPAEENVCAHLSLRGWRCVCCGAPARSSASLWRVAVATVGTWASRAAFEVRAGSLSAWPLVRLVSWLRHV